MLDLRTLFDSNYYLQTNPDVALAISRGLVRDAFDHFKRFGRAERRDPSPLFDTIYYLQTNTDLATAVEQRLITPIDHFIRYGQTEGRNPHPLFDTEFYLNDNPDVAPSVRRNLVTAFEHYRLFGQFENRRPSRFFDPEFYLLKYPQIARAIEAGTVNSAFEHYVRFGLNERLVSTQADITENLNAVNPLGILAGTQTVTDTVSPSQPVDIYSFILNTPSLFSASLNGLTTDADLEIVQDLDNNGTIGPSELIASSSNLGTAAEEIQLSRPLQPGVYYVRVSQFEGETPYRLQLGTSTVTRPLS